MTTAPQNPKPDQPTHPDHLVPCPNLNLVGDEHQPALPPPTAEQVAHLFEETASLLRRYVVLTAQQADLCAVWVGHTHLFAAFETTPYLVVTSPTMRAGKSRLFEVLELLVARPWRVESISPPALYRKVHSEKPTLLLDEVDQQYMSRALRGVLNSGYRAGGKVTRMEDGQPIDYSTFSPKAFAGIQAPLPGTVVDRSIKLNLQRRGPGETVARFHSRTARGETKYLHAGYIAFGAGYLPTLELADEPVPDFLTDRAAESWEPLFLVAAIAGRRWTQRLTSAAKTLGVQDDEPDRGVQLLRDVKRVFTEANARRLPSTDLLAHLCALEDPTYDGPRLETAGDLARALKPFGLKPKVLRFGNRTPRGYERRQFEATWYRYGV